MGRAVKFYLAGVDEDRALLSLLFGSERRLNIAGLPHQGKK